MAYGNYRSNGYRNARPAQGFKTTPAHAAAFEQVMTAISEHHMSEKLTDADVTFGVSGLEEQTFKLAAEAYVWNSKPGNDFLDSLRVNLNQYGSLKFTGQIRGVCNVIRHDIIKLNALAAELEGKRAAAQSPAAEQHYAETMAGPASDDEREVPAYTGATERLETSEIPNGIYTVVLGDGSHVTIKIADGWAGLEGGKRVASFLSGSDNTSSYTRFAFVVKGRPAVWGRFRDGYQRQAQALTVLCQSSRDQQREAGKAYAMASGKCFVCNRLLTEPESISLGIGPVCREATGF